jgi:cytochrome c
VSSIERGRRPQLAGRPFLGPRVSFELAEKNTVVGTESQDPSTRSPSEFKGRSFLISGLFSLLVANSVACSDPDVAILARLSEADQVRFRSGQSVAVGCWTCHDLAGTVKKVGPSLQGIYGRRSGLAPGYEGSPAVIGATIVWDDRTLRAFLSNPSGFIPGNRMVSPGIRNAEALSDLLFYLRHVTPLGARDLQ